MRQRVKKAMELVPVLRWASDAEVESYRNGDAAFEAFLYNQDSKEIKVPFRPRGFDRFDKIDPRLLFRCRKDAEDFAAVIDEILDNADADAWRVQVRKVQLRNGEWEDAGKPDGWYAGVEECVKDSCTNKGGETERGYVNV